MTRTTMICTRSTNKRDFSLKKKRKRNGARQYRRSPIVVYMRSWPSPNTVQQKKRKKLRIAYMV